MEHLFELLELPVRQGPARFAAAFPGRRLAEMEGFPAAAMPRSGRIASGRGLSAQECRSSCLGEAAELVSCCAWGDERLLAGREGEMGPSAIPPEVLNGFTPRQIAEREGWNLTHSDLDWRPPPRDRDAPLEWLPVDDAFGGKGALVPADCAFIGRREAGDAGALAIADSNGCAAGATADAARLAAILELIERDATGRWWYGARSRPPLALHEVEGAPELLDYLAGRARRTWLFDISSDLAVPVLAAASAAPDGRDVALGFAARLDANAAAVSALTEMLQMEIALAAADVLGEEARSWSYWRGAVHMATPPLDAALRLPSQSLRGCRSVAGDSGLAALLEACARRRIDLWLADMTRPALGVPAVRAFSTRLCHYKPRFAHPRLLAPHLRDSPCLAADERPLLAI